MKIRKKIKFIIMLGIIMSVFMGSMATGVNAHSLSEWSKRYTPERAGGEYQFSLDNTLHVDGNTVNYCWANAETKNLYQSAFLSAVNSWGGMIHANETDYQHAHVIIIYNSNASLAGETNLPAGNSHLVPGSTMATMVLGTMSAYSFQKQVNIIAHEIGHLWGINDLYHVNSGLDSVYSTKDYNFGPTRHDKNAMYIGLNDPWFINADGSKSYQKGVDWWARDEWLTINGKEYYFYGTKQKPAYHVNFNSNGGGEFNKEETKVQNIPLMIPYQSPSKSYTLTYKPKGGTMSYQSDIVNNSNFALE